MNITQIYLIKAPISFLLDSLLDENSDPSYLIKALHVKHDMLFENNGEYSTQLSLL